MKKTLFFCIAFMLLLCSNVIASEKLSTAIDIIANDNGMIKAGLVYNGEMCFDVDDFDNALMTIVSDITITKLPDQSVGRFMIGNLYAVENQVINREDFSSLKFIPKSAEPSEYTFRFVPNFESYELECTLKVIDEVNYSPIATNGNAVSTWTNKDTSAYGVLDGYDPDGDKIKFEIVSYPQNGLVEITNYETGDYKYTPFSKTVGKDCFSYRVRDEYGNYSAETIVNVKIEKLKTSLVFSDMNDHKALNAAYQVGEIFMQCNKNEDGTFSFDPDKELTKEEFLALIMDVMGAKNIPSIEKTRFADDKEIEEKYKGYFESAFALGILSGERKTDGIYMHPKSKITTAEGAQIIHKIIGTKSEKTTVNFIDESDIPEWAKPSVVSLSELGILTSENGKINPNSPLTRAQTAQILMSLLEYRGKLN